MRFWLIGFALGAGLASPTAAQEAQTYTYDAHGRLVQVVRTVGTTARTTTYTLDNADNRSQRATMGTTTLGFMFQPEIESQAESDPEILTESSAAAPATELSDTDETAAAAVPPPTV